MEKTYKIVKLRDGKYSFETKSGLIYCVDIKKSNVGYKKTIELITDLKFIDVFSFNLFDENEKMESDYFIRNTIIKFILKHLSVKNNDAVLFYVNNECDNIHFIRRGKSRLKLFRRLLRIANSLYNLEFILLTNEHFILNHQEYTMDYIGIIIKSSSPDYINIVRAFNKFCNDNSYQRKNI